MEYAIGQKLVMKKPHACGSKEWEVVRLGADIKIKCLGCGHCIFLLPDKLKKMLKPSNGQINSEN